MIGYVMLFICRLAMGNGTSGSVDEPRVVVQKAGNNKSPHEQSDKLNNYIHLSVLIKYNTKPAAIIIIAYIHERMHTRMHT